LKISQFDVMVQLDRTSAVKSASRKYPIMGYSIQELPFLFKLPIILDKILLISDSSEYKRSLPG
jgi:hypothetical protein